MFKKAKISKKSKPCLNKAGFAFFISLIFIFSIYIKTATANTEETMLVSSEQLKKIEKMPMWRRLLAFRPGDQKSQIISNDFFLSSQGYENPGKELVKTIKLLSQPINKNNAKSHILCTKPARTHWLDQFIEKDLKQIRNQYCTHLNNWVKQQELDSISIMMVSGYFGNPASTFGHALITLNTNEKKGTKLEDQSINFGALIPPNENTLVYVVKGLFGFYEAGYSDRQYYLQDLVYSQTESRDIWEYKLKMDKEKMLLAAFYLYEFAGKKYKYYFLDKNCAYRVTEFLEIIYDIDLHNNYKKWYLPVESFHTLRELQKQNPEILINGPVYIPSIQKEVYALYSQLSKGEKKRANEIIEQINNENINQVVRFLEEKIPAKTLNFLLKYMVYKYRQNNGEYLPVYQSIRTKLLTKRLALPEEKNKTHLKIKEVAAPSTGAKPQKFSFDFINENNLKEGFGFSFSPANFDALGYNKGQLSDSNLIALEVRVASNKNRNLYLDRIDVLKIKNLNITKTDLVGEDNKSWLVNTGIVRNKYDCFSCYTAYIESALGYTEKVSNFVFYGMLGGHYATAGSEIGLGPYVGLIYQPPTEKLKFEIEYKYDSPPPFYNSKSLVNLSMRYMLNKDLHLVAVISDNSEDSILISLNKYF